MRSVNKHKDFGYTRIDYGCAQDAITPSTARSRATNTTKRGCTWRAIAKALVSNGRCWTVEIRQGCESHNHEVGIVKRRFSPEHKAFIAYYAERPAISTREIAKSLRDTFPSIIFTRRQVKNARYKLCKDLLNGYTPFQRVKKELDEKGIYHEVRWSPDDNTKPTALFWSTEWSAEEWKASPTVQMFDNIYRTNNKGLALFQVIGISNVGKAYSCAFGLVDNERQENFN